MTDTKKVVITGGNSGIGFALAQKLLAENYEVIITSRSGHVEGFTHPQLTVVQLEITDFDSIKAATEQICKLTDRIDILVNNAGIAPDVFEVIPAADLFVQTMNVNVTGLVFFAEALLTHIADGGQVINVSTDMGLLSQAQPNGPAYRMSKAAVNMYTKMLSQRLKERNIRVTAIHPGWVRTKLGGDQAPMDTASAASGICKVIDETVYTGEFSNIYTGDRFFL